MKLVRYGPAGKEKPGLIDADGNLLDDTRGTNYSLILNGIAFNNPFQVGSKTITQLADINFDAGSNTLTATPRFAASLSACIIPAPVASGTRA